MGFLTATTLAVSIAASHHTIEGDWNERHLAARIDHGPAFATVYHNSEDRVSFGIGLRGERDLGYFTGFLEGALVTGYEDYPVLPLPRAGIERGGFSAWIGPGVLGVEYNLLEVDLCN